MLKTSLIDQLREPVVLGLPQDRVKDFTFGVLNSTREGRRALRETGQVPAAAYSQPVLNHIVEGPQAVQSGGTVGAPTTEMIS